MPGPHGFAVRISAVRLSRPDRSRAEARPAISFAPDAAASTASHPNVYDDPDTPLVGDEMAGLLPVIWGKWEEEYFLRRDWTGQITLNWFRKFTRPDSAGPAEIPSTGCSRMRLGVAIRRFGIVLDLRSDPIRPRVLACFDL